MVKGPGLYTDIGKKAKVMCMPIQLDRDADSIGFQDVIEVIHNKVLIAAGVFGAIGQLLKPFTAETECLHKRNSTMSGDASDTMKQRSQLKRTSQSYDLEASNGTNTWPAADLHPDLEIAAMIIQDTID